MTDERNGNGNKSNSSSNNNNSNSSSTSIANSSHNNSSSSGSSNNSSSSSNINNNERLIAEAAAKILLKNGINGANAAAAAATLLTAAAAAATFQLPAAPELKPTSTPTITSTSSSSSVTSNGITPTLSSTKISSSSSSSSLSMATASATMLAAAAPKPLADVMAGVLDYSSLNGPSAAAVVAASTKSNKFGGNGNGSSSFDMGRHPISTHSNNSLPSCGGRLQFFKDGKFILELARAKEGDKAGWVSVPRKAFRTPSAATSATVTPTSAVTTTYPKNENSTSLSFSDDNSSIQSSPWQRDQPWKQTRPRRGISKELSLYYQRPRYNVLNQHARKAAIRKRRRPYEPTIGIEDSQSIFERAHMQENGDETLKAIEVDGKSSEQSSHENQSVNPESIKEEITEIKTESETKATSPDDCKDMIDAEVKAEAVVEKMNTSEDEDGMSATVDDATPAASASASSRCLANGNANELNGDSKAHTKCEAGSEMNKRTTATTTTTDIRLKKQKPRAKLNSIIQKLIDGVPARLEQLSKTPATMATAPTTTVGSTSVERSSSSGGGAIGSLSHSLAHKVSPPSSAAAASRLVEYHHQHVSPRKRILREFEKVSLEDNNGCVNNGSGGTGGGCSSGVGGKRSRAKGGSSTTTNAVVSKSMPMNLAPPQAKAIATPTITSASASASAATQPTRLNSSYSIHSLLGGSGSSSSSSTKKTHDQPATIISNVHHPHHQTLYANSANYPRALLNSPKSPEMSGSNGGKSPSHAASKKQRSPPYATGGSPLPIDYGRRTPPDSYKLAQAHAQQLQHHSFYAPYVGTAVSPHIPQTGGGTRDLLSPPRSSSASPREPANAGSTPHRTVPKKTASIRREFASPTASNSNSSSTATSCPSPGERSTSSPERRHLQLQRGSPSAAAAAAAGSPLHYYMYPPAQLNGSGAASPHGAVPNAAAAAAAAAAYIPSVVSPSLFHPYITTLAAMRHNPLWVHHYQAGAAPLLPPPPPHPQSGSAGGARLSPQSSYHPFGYNGVSPAAVAAAAVASAYGQPSSNPHLGHPHPTALSHLNTPPTHLAEHRTHTPKLTDTCTDQMSAASSHRTTVSSSPASSSASVTSAGAAHGGGASSSGGSSVQSAMFQNSSLRNELSSDLPLNLSKH